MLKPPGKQAPTYGRSDATETWQESPPRLRGSAWPRSGGQGLAAMDERLKALKEGRSLPAIIAYVRGETAVAWMAADPGVTEETVAEMIGLSKYRLDQLLKKMGVDVQVRQSRGKPTFDPRTSETWQCARRRLELGLQ